MDQTSFHRFSTIEIVSQTQIAAQNMAETTLLAIGKSDTQKNPETQKVRERKLELSPVVGDAILGIIDNESDELRSEAMRSLSIKTACCRISAD